MSDTGGLLPADVAQQDAFAPHIHRLVENVLPHADLVLFMVDARSGLTPADEHVLAQLRKSGKPFVLVVNKAESPRHRDLSEWLATGLPEEDIFFISARTGQGVKQLLEHVRQHLPDVSPSSQKAEEEIPRIAIVGRPNVGKSTLLNALLGYERALVSEVAGTTRDLLEVPIKFYGRELIIVDTAGLRRKSAVDSAVEAYSITRTVKAIDSADVCVLVMDATEPATRQDLHIFRLIISRWKGVVVALNKWDLVAHYPHEVQHKLRKFVLRRLEPMSDVPLLTISAKDKKRVHKILDEALKVYDRMLQRIPTSQLNRYLLPIIREQPPPTYQGKYVKIKYVTQAGVKPPTFVFFVNHPEGITDSYARFLEKKIREKWDFTGVPLRLLFRSKWKKDES